MNYSGLLNSIVYLAILGILCFPMGRLLARIRFATDRFPFRQTEYEKTGKVYDVFRVKSWQSRVPDVSRMVSGIVPRKEIASSEIDLEKAALMINETCVAELTHDILCLLGIALVFIWPGIGGAALFIVYVFIGNIPFIMIQRYNRPRLIRVKKALELREKRKIKSEVHT